MKRLIYFILLTISLGACFNGKPPKGIIAKERMVSLLTEIHIANGYFSRQRDDDSIKQVASNYYNSIYKKYKIDSLEYERSLKYYSEQPKLMSKMYVQILSNMDTIQVQQQKIQDRINKKDNKRESRVKKP